VKKRGKKHACLKTQKQSLVTGDTKGPVYAMKAIGGRDNRREQVKKKKCVRGAEGGPGKGECLKCKAKICRKTKKTMGSLDQRKRRSFDVADLLNGETKGKTWVAS